MKSITSEIPVKANNFKIKVGTLNKKCPKTMYLEAGTYIKPTEESESYKSQIINIEKAMKLKTKEIIAMLPSIEKDFILVTDVAIGRISMNKGTHYTIQFHFRPIEKNITELNKTFGELAEEFINRYGPFFKQFEDIINSYGFTCSKTK
jgi:hypothetical protein